jgi:hypothetical protein
MFNVLRSLSQFKDHMHRSKYFILMCQKKKNIKRKITNLPIDNYSLLVHNTFIGFIY